MSATEALAQEERDFRSENQETLRFYFNVVVTTADLKIATFSPSETSLSDGKLTNAEVEDAPFVRFRKELSTRTTALSPEDFKSGVKSPDVKENTMLVVRATEILQFLSGFELSDDVVRASKHGAI